jgi:hypothetical protein
VAFDVHRLERPGDGTGPDRRARMVRFEPFFTAHSLVVAGKALMRPMEDDKPQMLEVFLGPMVQFALRVAADYRRYK